MCSKAAQVLARGCPPPPFPDYDKLLFRNYNCTTAPYFTSLHLQASYHNYIYIYKLSLASSLQIKRLKKQIIYVFFLFCTTQATPLPKNATIYLVILAPLPLYLLPNILPITSPVTISYSDKGTSVTATPGWPYRHHPNPLKSWPLLIFYPPDESYPCGYPVIFPA